VINEALEIKLKLSANEVLQYLKKTKKIQSARLEFIMDNRGLLYLIAVTLMDTKTNK